MAVVIVGFYVGAVFHDVVIVRSHILQGFKAEFEIRTDWDLHVQAFAGDLPALPRGPLVRCRPRCLQKVAVVITLVAVKGEV